MRREHTGRGGLVRASATPMKAMAVIGRVAREEPTSSYPPCLIVDKVRALRPSRSAMGTRKNIDQLADLAALIGLIAGSDRVLDAMRDVVAQDLLLDPAQRRAHRRNLGDDVDTVTVLLDHAREAAHLSLDALEPVEN